MRMKLGGNHFYLCQNYIILKVRIKSVFLSFQYKFHFELQLISLYIYELDFFYSGFTGARVIKVTQSGSQDKHFSQNKQRG